jgi:malate dehydrogenase (oxaloacetate-decarboxylating)(NADP+)
LLPPRVLHLQDQLDKTLASFRGKPSDIEKYIYLMSLQDRNERLFYRLVIDHLAETMPIIYTPTVGQACQRYAHLWRRPRGLFISARDRGRMVSIMRNWPSTDVRIIVITDGERILGLGDLGANGMGIPVGKLSLYSACAGIHPKLCLPVMLDVGTNNEELLNDPLYLGLHEPRLTGAAYDELVEEFVTAAREVFPGVVIQFEDFANHNAFRLLQKYRNRICTFNDDIQGTAAVVLAGLYSALRIKGGTLAEQRLLFLGAGEAATGIADLTVAAMVAQGLPVEEARKRCWLFDSKGLVVASRTDLVEHKLHYAHQCGRIANFASAVRELKPTAIIGVAAIAGSFTQEVVEEMGRINTRPIIFALSNPTSKTECTPHQAYEWTGGRALYASGSPFDPVTLGGRTFVSRQGNNSYIFPGVGLAAISVRAQRITDDMFLAAARALADQVTTEDLEQGSLYPPLASVRNVSAHLAADVARVAFKSGLAGIAEPDDLLAYMRSQMYDPHYKEYV